MSDRLFYRFLDSRPPSSRLSRGRKTNPSFTQFTRPSVPGSVVDYSDYSRSHAHCYRYPAVVSTIVVDCCCYLLALRATGVQFPPRGNREYFFRRLLLLLLLLLLTITTTTTSSCCLRYYLTFTHTQTMYYLRCAEKFTQETLYVSEVAAAAAGRGTKTP